jgi:carnitine O-acetyltransferase
VWQPQDLAESMRACIADVSPYLQLVTRLRFKFVCWLFVQTTKRPQKLLNKQLAVGTCPARAEGIARLYLGGRKSLVLHNHFPIALKAPSLVDHDCLTIAASLATALSLLRHENSSTASMLSKTRHPARFCDYLIQPMDSEYFVLLHKGHIFSVQLSALNGINNVRRLMEQIVSVSTERKEPCGLRLGECAALPRDTWFNTHRSIVQSSVDAVDIGIALKTLQNAAFLICIDDDTRPIDLTGLGRALRFQNIPNRFFDKCIQFVVFGNADCGLIFDHSIIDGIEAMQLAGNIHGAMSREAKRDDDEPINTQAKPIWQEMIYTLPSNLASKERGLFEEKLTKIASISIRLPAFNKTFFDSVIYPPDTLIQLAIQLCFFRCLGFIPSVFEPVSLSHLPGGRLDLISPVSSASRDLILAVINNQTVQQKANHLQKAVQYHRDQIRLAKQGQGHIGHLLALSALDFPTNQRAGATLLRLKEALFAAIDPGSRLLTQRDIVASNAGSMQQDAIELFGTMTHREDLFAIGYFIGKDGITLDIQANGKYAANTRTFVEQFSGSLCCIADISVRPVWSTRDAR